MNEDIMQALGFSEEIKQIRLGNCPFCREPILEHGFRDELSLREYRISGLCQKCQDQTFGDHKND